MQLNIENAPTSPLTTRSSYLYNGRVINHTIEITFSDFPFARPLTEDDNDSTHTIHVQNVDPKKIQEKSLEAINMLINSCAVGMDCPKYALIWQQIVGKENDRFESEPTILALSYSEITKH